MVLLVVGNPSRNIMNKRRFFEHLGSDGLGGRNGHHRFRCPLPLHRRPLPDPTFNADSPVGHYMHAWKGRSGTALFEPLNYALTCFCLNHRSAHYGHATPDGSGVHRLPSPH